MARTVVAATLGDGTRVVVGDKVIDSFGQGPFVIGEMYKHNQTGVHLNVYHPDTKKFWGPLHAKHCRIAK